MGYFIATLIGATLTFNAGDILASEQNQKKGLWIEYEYSERSVDDRHCNLNLGLSQITHFGGYHGSYAEEPSQQVQTGSSD